MDISENIKRIREQKGIKQSEMAKKLDIEQSNYFRLEKRGSKLTIEQLEQIAKALDISLLELLYPDKSLKKTPELNDLEKQNRELKTKNEIAIKYLNESHSFFKHLYLVFLNERIPDNPEKITIADINKLWTNEIGWLYNDREKMNRLNIESPLMIGLSQKDIRDTVRMLRENLWVCLQNLLPADDPRIDPEYYGK